MVPMSASTQKKSAVVTGGNRGLGLETCRQIARLGFDVILGARDLAKGKKSASLLEREGLYVVPHELDVADSRSIQDFVKFIEKEFGRVDVLVNNAGVMLDKGEGGTFRTPLETLENTLRTNVYGPFQLSQALIPM